MVFPKMRITLIFLYIGILFPNMVSSQTNCPIPVVEATYGSFKKAGQTIASSFTEGFCEDIDKNQLGILNCGLKNAHMDGLSEVGNRVQNSAAIDAVFQDIAGASHTQAVCRLQFLDQYKSNNTKREQLENSAEEAFNKVLFDAHRLLEEKKLLEKKLQEYESGQGQGLGGYSGGNSGLRQDNIRDKKNEIKKVEVDLTKMMLSIPMGYDPDVAKALLVMVEKKQFSNLDFYNSIVQAEEKYLETEKYYRNKISYVKNEKGEDSVIYCLGMEYRNTAGKSGELSRYINNLPDENPEQKKLKQNLKCHMSKYESGQKRFDVGVTVLAFGSLFFPPASTTGASVLGLTNLSKGAMAARTTLAGVAAVDTVMALDSLRQSCLPPQAIVSSDTKKCDAEKEFQRTIQEPKLSMCAMGAVLGAGAAAKAVAGLSKSKATQTAIEEVSSQAMKTNRSNIARSAKIFKVRPIKVKKGEPYLPIKMNDAELALANRNIELIQDPQVQKTAKEVYAKLNDSKAWDDYIRKLQEDTRNLMLKSPSSEVRALAEKGELTRTEMLRVLVQRGKARGDEFATVVIPSNPTIQQMKNANENFRQIAREKAFFDKEFKNQAHGVVTHLIQRDMVSDVIKKNLGADTKRFWNTIIDTKNPRGGSEERVWDTLFDNLVSNPTGPEFLLSNLRLHLPVAGF